LLAGYCTLQYQKLGSYKAAARRIGLNVKKYVDLCTANQGAKGLPVDAE
jgi:hypothetical protein